MPELVWTNSSTFHDAERGFISSGQTINPDESEVEDYLEHRSGGWEYVDDSDDEEITTSGSDEEANADESSDDETETGSDDVDYETHPRAELEEMDYSELQELARESGHPDINGRSSGDDIINALAEGE